MLRVDAADYRPEIAIIDGVAYNADFEPIDGVKVVGVEGESGIIYYSINRTDGELGDHLLGEK